MKWSKYLILAFIFSVVTFGSAFLNPAQTQGLAVTPKRVVLNSQTRHAKIHLMNQYSQPMMFRFEFIQRRMTEEGSLEPIPEGTKQPDEKFADEIIRYAPRQVKLDPEESQTVRLLVRKPKNLEKGEYRSHLRFRSVNAAKSNTIGKKGDFKKDELSASIKMKVHIAIPVIVRHGELNGSLAVKNADIEKKDKSNHLRFSLHNTGQRTVYGKLSVEYNPKKGEKKLLKSMNTGLYASTDKRVFDISLNGKNVENLDKGQIQLSFKEDTEDSNTPSGDSPVNLTKSISLSSKSKSN